LIHQKDGVLKELRQFAEYSIIVHSADDLAKVGKSPINSQISVSVSDIKVLKINILSEAYSPLEGEHFCYQAYKESSMERNHQLH
jgi:hypothetical protein